MTTNGNIDIYYKSYHCDTCEKIVSPDWQYNIDVITPLMLRRATFLTGKMPYKQVSDYFLHEYNIFLSPSWLQKLTEKVGSYAEADLFDIVPENKYNKDDIIIMQVDGSHVPMKNCWEEAKTLVIGTLQKKSKGDYDIVKRYYHATKGDINEFRNEIRKICRKLGIDFKSKNIIAMGDGGKWIWKMYDDLFPNATKILDFYHAAEYISETMNILWGEKNKRAIESIEYMCHEVKHSDDGALRIINAIDKVLLTKKFTAEQIENLTKIKNYMQTNGERMRYKHFQNLNLPIGTGLVESTQKWLLQARMKRAGMHWSKEGSKQMIALQLMLANKMFVSWFSKRFGEVGINP